MDIQKLRYFLTVANEGNITKAARLLYMTQPPLTYQLKSFEKELGVQLFEKQGRHIVLTAQGRFLAEKGPCILELVNQTMKELRRVNVNTAQSIIAIGNASPWGYTILPRQLQCLNKPFPNISFQLWQDDTHRIMDLLNNGEIEVAFVTLPTNPKRYESIALNIEPVYAFFDSDYDYGCNENQITLREIAASPNIIVHYLMHNLISTYYQRIGLTPKLSCHNDTISIFDWIKTEPWIILGPKTVFDLTPRPHIKYKLVVDPVVEVISYITYLKDHAISKVTQHFIDMILSKFPPVTRTSNFEIYTMLDEPDRLEKRMYTSSRTNKEEMLSD
jgi:DNA-binding transcriptional LysR family regulator